jgi:hypothetical protein
MSDTQFTGSEFLAFDLPSETPADAESVTVRFAMYRPENLRHLIRLTEKGMDAVAKTMSGTPVNWAHLSRLEVPLQGTVRGTEVEDGQMVGDVELDGEMALTDIQKRRNLRASIEFLWTPATAKCSICGEAWFDQKSECNHWPGSVYNGEQCYVDIDDAEGAGMALLYHPASTGTGIIENGADSMADETTIAVLEAAKGRAEKPEKPSAEEKPNEIAELREQLTTLTETLATERREAKQKLDVEALARFTDQTNATAKRLMEGGRIVDGTKFSALRLTDPALLNSREDVAKLIDSVVECMPTHPAVKPGQLTAPDTIVVEGGDRKAQRDEARKMAKETGESYEACLRKVKGGA